MRILFFFFVFTCCFSQNSQAQSYFGKTATLGTSFAPFFDKVGDDPIHYWEFSWSKNAAVQVAKNFDVGLNYINIYNHFPLRNSNRNTQQYLVSSFVDFVPFRMEKYALKLQLSYGIGNHCTCGTSFAAQPFKSEERLQYIGLALIGEWQLRGRLYLDVGFNFNRITNRQEEKDVMGYNNGSIGLNYVLGNVE